MMTAEDWAEMARHELMISHGADADRGTVAELFRRAMAQARKAALAEVRSVMATHLDDVCSSK